MSENPEAQDQQMPESDPAREPETLDRDDAPSASSRRAFLNKTARKAAYAAPLVLLLKPKSAAGTPGPHGSDITQP